MNEMKPEDVMKALECCADFNPKCMECPMDFGGEGCITLDQHALALLREKDAVIERLRKTSEDGAECPTCHGIGKIGTTNWLTKHLSKEQIAKEKAEAVAEFHRELRADTVRKMQERFSTLLEKEYKQYTPEGADHYFKNGSYMMWGVAERAMHQIAKEMLEGK